jgi:hypothetical protein
MTLKHPVRHLIAAAVLLQVAAIAQADDGPPGGTCDPTDMPCHPGQCYVGVYSILDPPDPAVLGCSEKVTRRSPHIVHRFPWHIAPESARLQCEALSDCTLLCQAWPTGSDISYDWSRTEGVQFNPAPLSSESYAVMDVVPGNRVKIRVKVFGPASDEYTEATKTVVSPLGCQAK